jgi:hypothetical protein
VEVEVQKMLEWGSERRLLEEQERCSLRRYQLSRWPERGPYHVQQSEL